jgi:hypothetical protein
MSSKQESLLTPVLKIRIPPRMLALTARPAGQSMLLSNMGKNLALLNIGRKGDSVPATVPESHTSHYARRFSLKLAATKEKVNAGLAGGRLPRSGMVRVSSYFRCL